jgi:hypothetical protein
MSSIAKQFYKDSDRWRKIWEANKFIVDPDTIYPGQRLVIPEGYMEPIRKVWPLKEEFRQAAYNLAFHVNKTKRLPIEQFHAQMGKNIQLLSMAYQANNFQRCRQIVYQIQEPLIIAETYSLLDSLTDLYSINEERACLLLALAWHESHFVNRKGSHGEVSFFQFLPATIKGMHPKNYSQILSSLNEDPAYATIYVNWYISTLEKQCGTLDKALRQYNHNPNYPNQVMSKYQYIKKILGM